MPRPYSLHTILRQTPNHVLAQYFRSRDVFTDFDFSEMKETKVEPLIELWGELPQEKRQVLDTELQAIFLLCCRKGFQTIFDQCMLSIPSKKNQSALLHYEFSIMENHYARAFHTFLNLPKVWEMAQTYYHAETLPYWRKRWNIGNRRAKVDDESLNAFAAALGNHFHKTEARGKCCKVDHTPHDDLDLFIASPEDYAQHSVEWVNGELGKRPHNPAFEVAFIYYRKEGVLSINFHGSPKAIEPLQTIFAKHILGLDFLPPNRDSRYKYDLTPLLHPDFSFIIPPGSGVSDVCIQQIRFSSKEDRKKHVTVKADCATDPAAIYDAIDDSLKKRSLKGFKPTMVEISATVKTNSLASAQKNTFKICLPNGCTLKYDKAGRMLLEVLKASGIEPKFSPKKVRNEKVKPSRGTRKNTAGNTGAVANLPQQVPPAS